MIWGLMAVILRCSAIMEEGVPETKLEVELNAVDRKCVLSAKVGGKKCAEPIVRLVPPAVFISGKAAGQLSSGVAPNLATTGCRAQRPAPGGGPGCGSRPRTPCRRADLGYS